MSFVDVEVIESTVYIRLSLVRFQTLTAQGKVVGFVRRHDPVGVLEPKFVLFFPIVGNVGGHMEVLARLDHRCKWTDDDNFECAWGWSYRALP